MKNIIQLLFMLFTVTPLITSCKKEKDTQDQPLISITFSKEALSYVKLPLDRYFIYKDSASGITDSVVVKESNIMDIYAPKFDCRGSGLFSFCFGYPAHNYQTFTLRLIKFTGGLQETWYSEQVSSLPFGPFSSLMSSDTAGLNMSGTYWYPAYNVQHGFSSFNIHSSIMIEGKIFTNVLQFISISTTDTVSAYYKKTNYYWAKEVGIIKREVRTATTLKTELLVRHG